MNLLINDANILIDLVHIELMSEFFKLGLEIKTTDFVFNELNETQKSALLTYIESGSLQLIVTDTEEDYRGIYEILDSNTGISFEDCSVWYYSLRLNGILPSGDARLRKLASNSGVQVRGILFIFDLLLINELIIFEIAIEKLMPLYQQNPRLPGQLINETIACWKLRQHHT